MKKAIIFALIACLVSTGATTAFLVKTHKPVVIADSLAGRRDSLGGKTATAKADSAKPAPVKGDSSIKDSVHAAVKPDSAMHPPVNPAGGNPGTGPLSGAAGSQAATRVATTVDPAAKATAYKQVARVLSAMKPVEAAKLLAFLSDEEVEGLLRAVGPRQAADFLSNMPRERAAGLSRRLLVPKEDGR